METSLQLCFFVCFLFFLFGITHGSVLMLFLGTEIIAKDPEGAWMKPKCIYGALAEDFPMANPEH